MTNTHSDLTAESPYKGWRANRRLLSEQFGAHQYDSHGRKLAHIAAKTDKRKLPTNTFFFEKNALVLYKNEGLNGQIRIIESNSCIDCFGAVYAYQNSGTGIYSVYVDVSYYSGTLKSADADRYKATYA